MTHVFAYGASMFMASMFAALLAWGFSKCITGVRHWPAFWSVLLLTALIVPLIAQAFDALSFSNPSLALQVPYVSVPMDAIGWLVQEPSTIADSAATTLRRSFVMMAAAFYLIGVLLMLLRLIIGRRRAWVIANKAAPLMHSSGTRIWVSPHDCAPFAIASLARRRCSRIVVSQHFIEQLSVDELSNVVEHERHHVENRDDEWGLLLRVALAFCWISPFAHLFFSRWLESVEVQCDRAVTENRSHENRRAYAETVLKAFRITANRVLQYPAASFSTRHLRSEKMRIEQILTGNTSSFKHFRHYFFLAIVTIGLCTIGTVVLSPNANADASAVAPGAAEAFESLLSGRLTSPFGMATDPFNKPQKRMHNGVDVAAPTGTSILAPANGVVEAATDLYDNNPAYGNVLVIRLDNGVRILLAHLDDYHVNTGQRIRRGTTIATVGNTGRSSGPHVHIETYESGKLVDPLTILPLNRLIRI